MSQITKLKGTIVVLFGLILMIAGCSDKNTKSSVDPDTGKHVVANWASPDVHGAWAKQPSSEGGIASCQECHGTDFSGGIAKTACSSCHGGSAPHPVSWTTGTSKHSTTDPSNAGVCAVCHTNGNNSPIAAPTPPAPAGTAPGCFNNTLCHAQAGHAAGWNDPAQHGAAAKKAPGTSVMEGFSGCETCHGGTSFSGAGAAPSCLQSDLCHGATVTSPHPPTPWRASAGSVRTHTTTDPGNAAVCSLCHTGGALMTTGTLTTPAGGTPGCFNSTLCHGQVGHAVGWADPAQHGASAKAAPNVANMTGFSTCRTCHGNAFNAVGGTATTSCLNTAGCHGATVDSPHAFPWQSTSARQHSTSDPANADVCGLCHWNNRQPPTYVTPVPGTPNCFDNTLCHGASVGCVDCHSVAQTGTHGTPRDAVIGEFGLAWGHKKTGRGAVTNADCIVCHLEGEYATQKRSATYHGNGNIDLRDPDGAGETPITDLNGAAFTFTKFSMLFTAGSRTSSPAANSIPDVISRKFCVACHDSNGATNLTARSNNGGTASQWMPFGGINLGANYTVANGATNLNGTSGGGGLVDVKTQFATTNSSYHPVLGPLNRDFPTAARMNDPYKPTGSRGTSGTKSPSVVINCFDCHNVSGASPLTTRTVAAHGNANTIRGSIYVSSTSTLCQVCHTGYTNSGNHGTGSAESRALDGGENMGTTCYNCHGSTGNDDAPIAPSTQRPVRAQDYHGYNSLVGGGLWPTISARPYAFIRNTDSFVYHRPFRGTETALQTGSATCQGGAGTQCAGKNGNQTYTPGGSY